MKLTPPLPASTRGWTLISIFIAVTLFWVSTWFYPLGSSGFDLLIYLDAGKEAWSGQDNLYGKNYTVHNYPYTNTPFSALVFGLFSGVGFDAGYLIFTILSVLIAAASSVVIVKWLYRQESLQNVVATPSLRGIAMILFGLISVSGPWRETMSYGQVNILLFGMIILDFALSKSKKWPEGVLVGIAAGIKLTPLVFGLYYVANRNWRALIGMGVGFFSTVALAFMIIPQSSKNYWAEVLPNTDRIGGAGFVDNLSIKGALLHFFKGDGFKPDAPWAMLSVLVIALAFIAVVGATRNKDMLSGIAITSLTMLLISPVSWGHHWVWIAISIPAIYFTVKRLEPHQEVAQKWGYLLIFSGALIFFLNPRKTATFIDDVKNITDETPSLWLKVASVGVFWAIGAIAWWVCVYWRPLQEQLQWFISPGKVSNQDLSRRDVSHM